MSRVYVVPCRKSRMGNEKPPSRNMAVERCTENYNRELPCAASLFPSEELLSRLTEDGGENALDSRCPVCIHQQQT
jgi:hypothetical protein